MSLNRLNKYKDIPSVKSSTNKNSSSNESKTKSINKKSKSITDRPLPRTLPPGNFNIDYTTFDVKIPNYTFGKAIELAGAGGLIAVSLGRR